MGQSFLRNAYTLLNLGDFVDDTSATRGAPFVQFEPLTNPTQAHKEFVTVRLGGVDTTGDSQWKLSSHQQSSPVSKGERIQHIEGFAIRNEITIAVCVGVVIILAFVFFCLRQRRSRNAAKSRSMLPANTIDLNRLGGGAGSYRQVEDPRSVPLSEENGRHN